MSKTAFLISFMLFSLGFPLAAYSQEYVSLDTLIKAAKQNNPELISARERWNASNERVVQEKTWDKPKLTLDWWTIPEGTLDLSNASEKMYGITQMIPFPGKLSARGGIAKSEAELMGWEFRETELRVVSEVKQVYSNYCYIAKAIETYRQIADVMQNFSKVAESRYVNGKSSQSEVLRAQVEAEKMSNMVTTLEQEQETVQVELNFLIGKNAEEKIGSPQDINPVYMTRSWDEIKTLTAVNNPALGKAKTIALKSKASKNLAGKEYLPDFDIAYRKKTLNNEPNGSDVMLGFTVPLWFWKQDAGVKEARHELLAAGQDEKQMELSAVLKAKESFTKLDADRRLIELYKNSILPKSEQSLKVSQSLFSGGESNFLEFLDDIRAYLGFKLEYFEYVKQYRDTLAQLELVTGTELDNGGSK
jgi:outer membrane protein TolC